MSERADGPVTASRAHRLVRMSGRDPHEQGRAATPLELLFDLTFVIAFAFAGDALAHAVAAGHAGAGILGFAFATFGTCWAWINFTWFASAFDTDDWIYRVLTMVQMLGVVIYAIGLQPMFDSLEHGGHVDNRLMVAGYVVMRVAMVLQWLRAAKEAPAHRAACLMFARSILIAQVGWIVLGLLDISTLVFFLGLLVLVGVETLGPVHAERRSRTPWHAHHVAERYGLLAIIALGEGVIGTAASMSAAIRSVGWSWETGLLGLAGIAITFAMWWVYFTVPFGELLHLRREAGIGFGYSHILIFGSIAAVGAGLHVAAYYLEGAEFAVVGSFGAVLAVAIPLGVFLLAVYLIYAYLMLATDPFHLWLVAGTALFLVLGVALAAIGVPMAICLAVLVLAPVVTVVGYEAIGHAHQAAAIDALSARLADRSHGG